MSIYKVRLVNPDESVLLADFGRETFYETWKHYNTESDMQKYLVEAFDGEKIKKDLLNTTSNTFLFSFEDDLLVGYAKMRNDRTSSEFEGDKALEIERIYVRKSHQGTQVAKLLMEVCLEKAKKEAYDWIWLGVNIDNHRAIAFYNKYNFLTYGSKMFKLGDAEDEDYLMKRKV